MPTVGTAPVELQRETGGTRLIVVWPDGNRTVIGASALRRACRCADCTARRARDELGAIAADIAITTLIPIGAYAVNISFSDGHHRGIFPWSYLRSLAASAAEDEPLGNAIP